MCPLTMAYVIFEMYHARKSFSEIGTKNRYHILTHFLWSNYIAKPFIFIRSDEIHRYVCHLGDIIDIDFLGWYGMVKSHC